MAFGIESKALSTTPACGVNRFRKLAGPAVFKSVLMGLVCLFAQSSHVNAQILTASDGENFGSLGLSVSQSGNTAVVAAPADNDNGSYSGSAYVFRDLDSTTGSITESAKLTASDGAASDYFGNSVSLSGNTAIVGAPIDGDNGSAIGSAYLFRGLDTATGSITESVKLTASDGAADHRFGQSVSQSGNTAIVGARGFHGNFISSGSAYVFRDLDTATGSITESVKLIPSDVKNDFFGLCVSLLDNTAIVGAPSSLLGGAALPGSAYVFRDLDTATGSTTESFKLTGSDGAEQGYFGSAISQWGNTAIVGAYGDEGFSGAAYVFHDLDTATGSITESVKLTASDGESGDSFGLSVSKSGNKAIVGSHGNGSVYVFRDLDTATGSINESVKLTASNGATADSFGASVSLEGDRFLIGAPRGDGVVANSGVVFSGTVSSLTTLDLGNHSSIIERLSFESRTDWIIGENTSGNHLLLSENDWAKVLSSGKAIYIGDNAGSNGNRLTIAGTVDASDVYLGDEGNSGNVLVFEDSASHFIDSIYLAEGNSLSIEGDHASYLRLNSYLFLADLFVARAGTSELVTASNFDRLLATNFDSATGFTNVTVAVNSGLLGDVNLDGVVTFLDIAPFIAILSNAGFQEEADCNEDGLVSFLDIAPFIAILSTTNGN